MRLVRIWRPKRWASSWLAAPTGTLVVRIDSSKDLHVSSRVALANSAALTDERWVWSRKGSQVRMRLGSVSRSVICSA